MSDPEPWRTRVGEWLLHPQGSGPDEGEEYDGGAYDRLDARERSQREERCVMAVGIDGHIHIGDGGELAPTSSGGSVSWVAPVACRHGQPDLLGTI